MGDAREATGDAPGLMSMPANELYVYYKVAPGQRAAAALAVADLLARCRLLGVTARLMQRREAASDGTETWMEVYGDVPDDFEGRLDSLVRELGLPALSGERRIEWFVACN